MGDGRSSTNAVFCGAHVGHDAADGDNRFVIIGFNHDDVLQSGECVFLVVVRPIWVEVFLLRFCDERQT